MANYHFTTKIIKASKGKCAVASAAYQAAEKLYDERLGESFSYTHKEEVVHSEIMLPVNAPEHLKDRAILWNEVEKIQRKSNARYARQFEFSLPIEWSVEECIERARDFIQKNFVDRGMICDWSFHDKPGNPHIHLMCPTRGFNQDGTWTPVNKSVYALDADGNKIPDINPETGLQKVRVRKGKGEEKLWLRVNNPTNDWNKRDTLIAWRKAWSEYANHFLEEGHKIDHRSYEERGIEKVPGIHYAPGMNDFERRGGVSWQMQENREIKRINDFFEKVRCFIKETKMQLAAFKVLILRRKFDGETRSVGSGVNNRRTDASNQRIPSDNAGTINRATSISERVGTAEGVQTENRVTHAKAGKYHH